MIKSYASSLRCFKLYLENNFFIRARKSGLSYSRQENSTVQVSVDLVLTIEVVVVGGTQIPVRNMKIQDVVNCDQHGMGYRLSKPQL